MKILVLQGIPFSGKSTYAKEFIKNNPDWIIVSKNSIIESIGNSNKLSDYISEIELFQIEAAIKRKLNIIIDSINLNPSVINKWTELAKKSNYEIYFKLFKIDYKQAITRCENSNRNIDKETITRFFQKYFPLELTHFTNKKILNQVIINLNQIISYDLNNKHYFKYLQKTMKELALMFNTDDSEIIFKLNDDYDSKYHVYIDYYINNNFKVPFTVLLENFSEKYNIPNNKINNSQYIDYLYVYKHVE